MAGLCIDYIYPKRFQEPSNALWLSSHFVKKIDQAWVFLVGSNSVVARAIYEFEFEFELVTGQAATADLSRGTARVNNYKINKS